MKWQTGMMVPLNAIYHAEFEAVRRHLLYSACSAVQTEPPRKCFYTARARFAHISPFLGGWGVKQSELQELQRGNLISGECEGPDSKILFRVVSYCRSVRADLDIQIEWLRG